MKRTLLLVILVLALADLTGVRSTEGWHDAQSGGGYDLTWSTIDGGGGMSMGTGYVLMGAIGQPEAGAMSGGGYTFAGGLWVSGISGPYRVYLPLVMRD